MTHFNNRSGFGLVEALLAVAIITFALAPLLLLEGSRVRLTSRFARLVDRIQVAHDLLVKTDVKQPEAKEPIKEESLQPVTTFTYSSDTLPTDSALAVFRSVRRERVTMRWREQNNDKEEELIFYRYQPPTKETQ